MKNVKLSFIPFISKHGGPQRPENVRGTQIYVVIWVTESGRAKDLFPLALYHCEVMEEFSIFQTILNLN